MWERSQTQSEQKEAGSKSMGHARRVRFATDALLSLVGKSEGSLPPVAKQPQGVDRGIIAVRCVNSSQLASHDLTIATIFATVRPLSEKHIFESDFSFPSHVLLYFMQASLIHLHKRQD
jgi:hypothetical protein